MMSWESVAGAQTHPDTPVQLNCENLKMFFPPPIHFLLHIALENFSASVMTVPVENGFTCYKTYRLEHHFNPDIEKGKYPVKKVAHNPIINCGTFLQEGERPN